MAESDKHDIDLVRQLFEERWRGHMREHELLAENVALARTSVYDKLAAMNEIRGTLSDQAAKMVTREEWAAALSATRNNVDNKIEGLTKLVYMGVGIAMFLGAFSGLIVYFVTHK